MQIRRSVRFRLCACFGVSVAAVLGAGRTVFAQVTPQAAAPPPISGKAEVKKVTRTLFGLIVDTSGAPVAHMPVSMAVIRIARAATATQPESGSGYRNLNTSTDREGKFVVPNIASDEEISLNVRGMDYRYVSGGDVNAADDGLHVTLRVAKLSAQISGQVVDGKGRPIAGAEVWAVAGGAPASTITDDAGAFTLRHLPAGSVKVEAAQGTRWSEQNLDARVMPDGSGADPRPVSVKPVSIVLSDTPPSSVSAGPPAANTLLSRMVASKSGEARVDRSDLANYLAETDLAAALHLASTVHKPGEALADGVIANCIEARLKADPRAAAAWALPRVAQMGQAMTRIRSNCEIGIALSYDDPIAAAKWYDSCRADSQQPNAAVDLNRARLVALAALLHKPADEAAHLKLLAGVLDAKSDTDYTRVRCAEQVARGDIAAAETLIEKATPSEKVEFYTDIVHQCLKYSPSLCRLYLAKLQSAVALLASNHNESWRVEHATQLTIAVITALGPTDPAGALAVARGVPETASSYPLALATAARFQGETTAGQLLTAASAKAQANLADTSPNAGELQYYARQQLVSIASEAAKGPSSAAKACAPALWAAALRAVTSDEFGLDGSPDWAVAAARFDPGIARMLLEHTYADARDQPPGSSERYLMLQAALAMTVVEPARAVELLDHVPGPSKLEAAMNGYDVSDETDGGFPDDMGDSTRLEIIRLLTLTPGPPPLGGEPPACRRRHRGRPGCTIGQRSYVERRNEPQMAEEQSDHILKLALNAVVDESVTLLERRDLTPDVREKLEVILSIARHRVDVRTQAETDADSDRAPDMAD